MSMDNRQEIINVLDMKEHMVFRNRRMPVGQTRETKGESSHKDCAQNKSLREREGGGGCYCGMAATAQLLQQV